MGVFSAVMDIGNYLSQVGQQVWAKKAQEKTWEREDTAVQRRAADLEAAGLSKTLAAGSSASTSSPINVGAPQFRPENIMKSVEYAQAKKQMAVSDAQIQLLKEQANNNFVNAQKTIREQALIEKKAPYEITKAMFDERMAGENLKFLKDQRGEYNRNIGLARLIGVPSSSPYGMDVAAEVGRANELARQLKNKNLNLGNASTAVWQGIKEATKVVKDLSQFGGKGR